jgi:hypothetical protein
MDPHSQTITYLCKDLVRYVCDLKGVEFLEQEAAFYRHRMVMPPAPLPAPLPTHLPALPPLQVDPIHAAPLPVIKREEVVIIDSLPVPLLPTVVQAAVVAPAPAPAPAPVPTPVPENRIVEIAAPPAEKTRYKRVELPDERRCTANTSRGSRCTLERDAGQAVCSRHAGK